MEDEQKLAEAEEAVARDTFGSLDELVNKISLPVNFHWVREEECLLIFSFQKAEIPSLAVALKIFPSLHFKLWYKNTEITKNEAGGRPKLATISELTHILKTAVKVLSDEDIISEIVEKLTAAFPENAIIGFLAEQLSLTLKKPTARRYSPDTLAQCALWDMTSPALYKQLSSGQLLTLPHYKYLRSLTSAIGNDLKLNEPSKAYLKARYSKHTEREKVVSLLMDEVHTVKNVELSNGCFFGLTNNEITKTLFSIMVKSVASKYRDVVSLTPISNINSDKITAIWHNCVEVLTEIGYDVCITMTDGHDSNVKFFKQLSGDSKLHEPIINPYNPDNKIFKMFDPTHLFKNCYNNLNNKKTFTYPAVTFNEDDSKQMQKQPAEEVQHQQKEKQQQANVIPTITGALASTKFSHLRDLFEMERAKPLRMAHKLNEKILKPSNLEKTNVGLAEAFFHESTIAALSYYAKHGHPEFSGTANYLKIIRIWFNLLNVKSLYHGKNMNDATKTPLTKEDRGNLVPFLK